MKSTVIKRSVVINGHKTSVSLEDQFWAALKEIAAERKLSMAELIAVVDHDRGKVGNLSSALRLFVLAQYYIRSMPHRTGQCHGIESVKRRGHSSPVRVRRRFRQDHFVRNLAGGRQADKETRENMNAAVACGMCVGLE